MRWFMCIKIEGKVGNKFNIKKFYLWYAIPLWNFWIFGKYIEDRN